MLTTGNGMELSLLPTLLLVNHVVRFAEQVMQEMNPGLACIEDEGWEYLSLCASRRGVSRDRKQE